MLKGFGLSVAVLAFTAACGSDGSGESDGGAGGAGGSSGSGGNSTTGGAGSGGVFSAGGTSAGGTSAGGASAGGTSAGGASAGGAAGAGGISTGGTGTGGASTGGAGGTAGTGGASTGGSAGTDGGTEGGVTDGGPEGGVDGGGDSGADSTVAGPSVAFTTTAAKTWEGTGKWAVGVTLSAVSATDVTVHYAPDSASTASGAGVDYTLAAGTLTIPAGQTTGTIQVTIANDAASEADETIVVVLSAPGNATLGANTMYTLTVVDDGLHAWPGQNTISTVDPAANTFAGNMSDLSYQPPTGGAPAVIWAIQNSPSTMYRLVQTNGKWGSATTDSWTNGKVIHWPGAEGGNPDSEGLTKAEYASSNVYVSTERDNTVAAGTHRYSVLRYDTSAAGASLTAAQEWNLTQDLPAVNGNNLGLEAITWVPDSYLTARGFYDEGKAKKYAPADYPNHGTGIFLVGLEATGTIFGYVLDDGGTFHKVATIASGLTLTGGNGSNIMGLSFDRDVGKLWALCDDHCSDSTTVLDIETNPLSTSVGKFQVRRTFSRPGNIPANMNNEGMAFAPESECSATHFKAFYWVDDDLDNGFALRTDAIPCGDFL